MWGLEWRPQSSKCQISIFLTPWWMGQSSYWASNLVSAQQKDLNCNTDRFFSLLFPQYVGYTAAVPDRGSLLGSHSWEMHAGLSCWWNFTVNPLWCTFILCQAGVGIVKIKYSNKKTSVYVTENLLHKSTICSKSLKGVSFSRGEQKQILLVSLNMQKKTFVMGLIF